MMNTFQFIGLVGGARAQKLTNRLTKIGPAGSIPVRASQETDDWI
jgi:hypothetical protein